MPDELDEIDEVDAPVEVEVINEADEVDEGDEVLAEATVPPPEAVLIVPDVDSVEVGPVVVGSGSAVLSEDDTRMVSDAVAVLELVSMDTDSTIELEVELDTMLIVVADEVTLDEELDTMLIVVADEVTLVEELDTTAALTAAYMAEADSGLPAMSVPEIVMVPASGSENN